ncbi:MAG: hypothetical protein AAGD25_12615 [Cyanobacteria bacterium P01_F01_bin.150]
MDFGKGALDLSSHWEIAIGADRRDAIAFSFWKGAALNDEMRSPFTPKTEKLRRENVYHRLNHSDDF